MNMRVETTQYSSLDIYADENETSSHVNMKVESTQCSSLDIYAGKVRQAVT
jgi:hypothetical protein